MKFGKGAVYKTARECIRAYYWNVYLSALEKIRLQGLRQEKLPQFDLTIEEEKAFKYFNKGNTRMLSLPLDYTEEQKEYLTRRYFDAYRSAVEKSRIVEELGNDAYTICGLKPEYRLTYNEQAALRLEEENPGLFTQANVRVKKIS